jgi:hypothetical protein
MKIAGDPVDQVDNRASQFFGALAPFRPMAADDDWRA